MMRHGRTLAVAALFIGPLAGAAEADQIVGSWCPPGGSVSLVVRNYDDVVFNGQAVKATVARHRVEFDIPAGADAAGQRFSANQLNDDEISVTIGAKPAEIWTPCKPIS